MFLERPFVILWKNVPWMEVSAKCVDDFRPRSVRFHLRCQWTSIFPSGIFAFLHRSRLIISIHRYISFDIYLSRNSSSSSSLDLSIVIFFFLRNHIEKLNSNVIRFFHSLDVINSKLSIIWWIDYENFVLLVRWLGR